MSDDFAGLKSAFLKEDMRNILKKLDLIKEKTLSDLLKEAAEKHLTCTAPTILVNRRTFELLIKDNNLK